MKRHYFKLSVLSLVCLVAAPAPTLAADELTKPLEGLRLFFAPDAHVKPDQAPRPAESRRKPVRVPDRPQGAATDVRKGYAVVKGAGGVQTIIDDIPQPRLQ